MTQTPVDSRWWILIVGVLLWAIFSTILLITAVVFQVGGDALVLLSYGAIGLLILLPIGLYMDGREVLATETGWTPDLTLYVVASIIGVFIPVISALVAGLYLYRRHVFIGVP